MDLAHLPIIGWLVILTIAVLIFVLLMLRGIKIGFGDKNLSIGGRLEKKIDGVKKELEEKQEKTFHDEKLRIQLYKKSIHIDEHLNADLRKTVRRLDGKICSLLEPFSTSFFLSMGISEIIKGELNERLDYNNIREKLSGREREGYLKSILQDIRDKYSTFLIHLLTQSHGSLKEYPQWDDVEKPIKQLVTEWEKNVVGLLCSHIEEKVKMYEGAKNDFKTEEYIENSVTYPIDKNNKYLSELRGATCYC